jgi:hypothetical protein
MANTVTSKEIERCAELLINAGCHLMPLTRNGKTPFDIAEKYQNEAFACVKYFCGRQHFGQVTPMKVSSIDRAKKLVTRLACPTFYSKVRKGFDVVTKDDFLGLDGLFLLYQTQQSKKSSSKELGICLYHENKVHIYPISTSYPSTISGSADQVEISYWYTLMSTWEAIESVPEALFRSFGELIYNHTKHAGFLPTTLKCCIQLDDGKVSSFDPRDLLFRVCESKPVLR